MSLGATCCTHRHSKFDERVSKYGPFRLGNDAFRGWRAKLEELHEEEWTRRFGPLWEDEQGFPQRGEAWTRESRKGYDGKNIPKGAGKEEVTKKSPGGKKGQMPPVITKREEKGGNSPLQQ